MNRPAAIPSELPASPSHRHSVGAQLRQRRRVRGLTLTGLSALCGLSVGLLSQIERDLTSPSLKSLTLICDALGITMGWLFDRDPTEGAEGADWVVRRGSRRQLDLGPLGVTKELLSPDLGGDMQMYLVSIRPGGQSGPDTYTHKGEEGGMVLSGSLELTVDGRTLLLHEGDSFRFRSTLPHRFANPGPGQAQVVWINSLAFY